MMDEDAYMLTPIIALLLFLGFIAYIVHDKGAWETCRAKHSKQVCVNLLQETEE